MGIDSSCDICFVHIVILLTIIGLGLSVSNTLN